MFQTPVFTHVWIPSLSKLQCLARIPFTTIHPEKPRTHNLCGCKAHLPQFQDVLIQSRSYDEDETSSMFFVAAQAKLDAQSQELDSITIKLRHALSLCPMATTTHKKETHASQKHCIGIIQCTKVTTLLALTLKQLRVGPLRLHLYCTPLPHIANEGQ